MHFITTMLFAAVLAVPLAQANPRQSPHTVNATKTVLLVGDSLSSAHRISPDASWVVLLQQRLDKATSKAPRIVNASHAGKTLNDALKELPTLLATHHPQLVILELGGNDAVLGASQQELQQNMTQLIDLAKASGARVAILGFEIPTVLNENHCAETLRQAYIRVQQDEHVALLPSLMEHISDKPTLLLDDGVHPTAAAQVHILDNAWVMLRPLLLD